MSDRWEDFRAEMRAVAQLNRELRTARNAQEAAEKIAHGLQIRRDEASRNLYETFSQLQQDENGALDEAPE